MNRGGHASRITPRDILPLDRKPIIQAMSTASCYFCDAQIPREKAKKCSRCRLVTYCSKECQIHSWKLSHKMNCVPNPTIAALNGAKPEMFSKEWIELQVDKQLSKWIAEWRKSFTTWTKLALDLANHPPDRVMTHCLHIIIEPRHFQEKVYRNYSVVDAKVVALQEIRKAYPELVVHVDPQDFTRLRFVITLQNEDEELLRVRLCQWNSAGLDAWRKMGKDVSGQLAERTCRILMYSVEKLSPAEVEDMVD